MRGFHALKMNKKYGVIWYKSICQSPKTYLNFHYIACYLPGLSYTQYKDSDNIVACVNLPNMHYPKVQKVDVYAQSIQQLLALGDFQIASYHLSLSFCPSSALWKPVHSWLCLLYTSPSPRDKRQSRMPSSA